MFLADLVLRTVGGTAPRGRSRTMDIKIYVLMLLIGFLSVLYHAGTPVESGEREQA